MPACHRCERVQATAELRRTSLGFVCKDNDKWSRCAAIAKELRAKARAAKRADTAARLRRRRAESRSAAA
jgi:hypothetical protein